MTWWAAPSCSHPLEATVQIPGSKSATARALVLSSLADAPGSIRGGLAARDTDLMIAGLRVLGAGIDVLDPSSIRVSPIKSSQEPAVIECGLAGTVMRFLPALAALGNVPITFRGDAAASARPMTPLLDALRQLGATVVGEALPCRVTGPISGADVIIDSSASSQFISALLLAAARFPQGLRLTHRGGTVPSLPHIDMTIAALETRGVVVDHSGPDSHGDMTWQVGPQMIQNIDEVIEPDLTTAAVFLAAALVTGGWVVVPGWPSASTQPGTEVPHILEAMGGLTELDSQGLRVSGTGQIHGIDIDLHDTSELTPVVAGLAALAESETTIRGVAHIRGHETDRLAALSCEINRLGGDCRETDDGLVIRPVPLHAGLVQTHADHRMAHCAALIGLRVAGVSLDDIGCTTKTMPGFATAWESLAL